MDFLNESSHRFDIIGSQTDDISEQSIPAAPLEQDLRCGGCVGCAAVRLQQRPVPVGGTMMVVVNVLALEWHTYALASHIPLGFW